MNFKHVKFTEGEWKVDRLVINPNISPEMDSISINSTDYVSYKLSLPTAMGVTNLGIDWYYTIENHNRIKEILFCSARDLYNVSKPYIEEADKEKVIELTKESFKRFSDYFDKMKIAEGLKNRNLLLFEPEIEQFHSSLILKLLTVK